MNWQRIWALVCRNMTLNYRGIDPLIDILYWPLFDLLLWGFTSRGVETTQAATVSVIWLTCLVFWQTCVRSNVDISQSFLSELWSHTIISIFASPLKLREWVCAAMLLGAINATIVLLFGALMTHILYGVNVFTFGAVLVPLFVLLVQSGWIIGLFTAGCIMYGGLRVQKIIWVFGWVFAPFSAIFYLKDALPLWAYYVSQWVPMSYLFEGLRSFDKTGVVPSEYFVKALSLNCIYGVAAVYFMVTMFNKSKVRGLARLEKE